ncbi:E3 ubiquitin-protein ligase ATL6 [Morella rubra]|uniref:RING-type E3 ubiquitin transferase n=1 Tax=Morella rubra TaxID=262757 RepID=A0A6A1VNQ5_9ROSI|nr:E3 ubiquitin-protein ligase ATL6 [Morella rubra]
MYYRYQMKAQIKDAYVLAWAHMLLLALACLQANAQTSTDYSDDSSSGNGWNINPITVIISLVLVFAVFLLAFLCIYFFECNNSRYSIGGADSTLFGSGQPPSEGLDPAVLNTFPILTYSVVKGLKIGRGGLECAVCLIEFEDHDTLRLLPKCNHVFHHECIDTWLACHVTCPVCRAKLYPEANEIAGFPSQSTGARNESVRSNSTSRHGEQQDHVVINVEEIQCRGCAQAVELVNRPPATRISGKFTRSHSTGHSLVHPEEITDRFTLILPEEVRKLVLEAGGNQNPPTNRGVVLFRVASARIGYRSVGTEESWSSMLQTQLE